ncbi:MAG: carboxypeptidase-like regulatory domain-containing protein [Oscillospiraceae bacterium]|nr:carboxypeptidase-like regulatory domain-containing protein [Oscillospiraceae bacterium]
METAALSHGGAVYAAESSTLVLADTAAVNIIGTVYAQETGAAMPGAALTVRCSGNDEGAMRITSDETGRFQIQGLLRRILRLDMELHRLRTGCS